MTSPITQLPPFAAQGYRAERQRIDLMVSQLKIVRATHESHWTDCGAMVQPRRARFFAEDANKGDRRNQDIIDSSATFASRTQSAGMMSGVTSPARPWFRLSTPDPSLAEIAAVKEWLHLVTTRMITVFVRSNLYRALPTLYTEMGVFATAAMSVEEDDEDVIRCTSFPVGSYWVGNDAKGRVRVFARNLMMTVRQILEKFCEPEEREGKRVYDLSKLSMSTRGMVDSELLEQEGEIWHVVYPNPDYHRVRRDGKHKQFRSVYFETGSVRDGEGAFLRIEGFDEFPVLVPRWETTGEDAYGTNCPAMTALGDIKQLQRGEKRGLQALEKMVNPPMQGPTELKTSRPSILPGEITYHGDRGANSGLRPVHEVSLSVKELEEKQAQVRLRISRAFYEDLFLMLANTDRRQITAREIEERHEEKLLALGPVLEQLNQDLLDPLIDRTFAIMLRRGLIPPPPEELQGQTLKVEYISIMAQAQRMIGIAGLERMVGYVTALAQYRPDVLDKVDLDQSIDEMGEMTGVSPRIIVPDEEVVRIRAQRAQEEQAAKQTALAREQAATTRDLAAASTAEPNALTDLLGQGGAAPGVVPPPMVGVR